MISLAMVVGASGCQQRVTGKLLGRWIGRADSVIARTERESQKYGDARPDSETAIRTIAVDPPLDPQAEKTDWERYNVAVLMNFVSRDRVEMSLAGGKQPRLGRWSVVATTPTSCTIEVETNDSATQENGAEPDEPRRRRFHLELDERDGVCVGFLLNEVGADRQLGALYFRRPGEVE